ncbi:MAG: branched-chain amino acid ABC transporter permease [Actinobacteria bacterium]|nr:branched-chain amino acid ABC transporter permease [Actinomycetota bacterium]
MTGPRDLSVQRSTTLSKTALVIGVVTVAVLVSVPLWADQSTSRTLVSLLTLIALAQMWNLLAGYAGLMSVGQQGYIGIGAYSLWLLTDVFGLHPFLAVPLTGLFAAAISLPTAALVFRLKGGYFAIGTWVMAEILRLIVANIPQTGGGSGRTITAVAQMPVDVRMRGTYWLALAAAVGAVLVVYAILRARVGLALTAIRDNEPAVESLGVHVFRAKLSAYVLAAFGCAVTGAVVYMNLLRIQPDSSFSISWTATMIFIVVIGGVGTIEGPILGAIIYFTLQETLSSYGSWYLILLGVLAVVITVWFPGGLWGTLVRRWGVHLFPVQRRLRLGKADEPE